MKTLEIIIEHFEHNLWVAEDAMVRLTAERDSIAKELGELRKALYIKRNVLLIEDYQSRTKRIINEHWGVSS